MLLQLKRNWPTGRFQRVSRGADGSPLAHFKWTRDAVVDVPDEHLECVLNDIGNSLMEVAIDEKGKPRPVLSHDTAEVHPEAPSRRRGRRSERLVEA